MIRVTIRRLIFYALRTYDAVEHQLAGMEQRGYCLSRVRLWRSWFAEPRPEYVRYFLIPSGQPDKRAGMLACEVSYKNISAGRPYGRPADIAMV